MQIKIRTRNTPLNAFKGMEVIDVTSYSREEKWRKFSPFYPHGGIPVPGWPEKTAESVEGIWQGLKFMPRKGIDEYKFYDRTMRYLKRHGKPLGHQWGNNPNVIIPYIQARYQIYLPSYKFVLDTYLQEELKEMKRLASKPNGIVLLDIENNENVDDTRMPLSHASLIKHYLLGTWPEARDSYAFRSFVFVYSL